jgi:transposase
LNNSDTADSEDLAQLARTGWFTPVHIRSGESERFRSLLGARERLIRLRKELEAHIRGVLKTFGIRMAGISSGRQRQAFRDQLAAAGEIEPVLRAIADGFIAAHTTMCRAAADLSAAAKNLARQHPVAQRLMTIPGVGPVMLLRFSSLKYWALRLSGRRGVRKADVATARKIAVLMLALWRNETEYQGTKEATA